MEEVIDLLVDGGGDDFDLREGVGHGMNTHLSHEQRNQQDLLLLNIMILHTHTHTRYEVCLHSSA